MHKDREAFNAYMRERYKNNPEVRRKLKECVQRWEDKNIDRVREYRRQWVKQDREKNYKHYRDYEIKRKLLKYGVTLDWYEQKLEEQKGVCAICGEPEQRMHWSGTPLVLAVDHDHKTGEIRGLLCHNCNTRLHEKGGTDWLKKALRYLEKF